MKIRQFNPVNFGLWLLVIVAVASIFMTIATLWSQPYNVRMFYNPDLVGDTYVVHTLIYNHDSILNWRLTNAFFLFPDITLIFIISLFTKYIYPIYPVFAFLQCTAFIILTSLLFKVTTQTNNGLRIGFVCALAYFIFLISVCNFSLYGYYDYLSTALVPSFHYGSSIIAIAAAILFMTLLQQQRLSQLFLLSFLVIITGISDPLLHYYFTFPAAGTVILLGLSGYLEKKSAVRLVVWFVAMIVIWYVVYTYVPLPFQKIHFQLTFPFSYFSLFIATARVFWEVPYNDIIAVIWLLFFFLAPVSLLWNHFKNRIQLVDYFILFEFLLIICGILGILTTNVKFLNGGTDIPIRYMIPLIISPVFFGFPLLLYKQFSKIQLSESTSQVIYAMVLITITGYAWTHRQHFVSGNFLTYYPDNIQCFDLHAKSLQLENGIVVSQWGEQNVFNAYSRSGSKFILVGDLNSMTPHLWFSTAQIYKARKFNFVMMAEDKNFQQNKLEMLKKFGKPSISFVCSSANDLMSVPVFFVYKNEVRIPIHLNSYSSLQVNTDSGLFERLPNSRAYYR